MGRAGRRTIELTLVCGLVAAGCGSGTPGYAGDEVEMNRDAVKLADSLAGLTRNVGVIRVEECSDDTAPTTRVELALRGSHTQAQLRAAAATELRTLDYTVDGEANPEAADEGTGIIIAGSRELEDGRESKVAIELTDATDSTYDYVLAASLDPAC